MTGVSIYLGDGAYCRRTSDPLVIEIYTERHEGGLLCEHVISLNAPMLATLVGWARAIKLPGLPDRLP